MNKKERKSPRMCDKCSRNKSAMSSPKRMTMAPANDRTVNMTQWTSKTWPEQLGHEHKRTKVWLMAGWMSTLSHSHLQQRQRVARWTNTTVSHAANYQMIFLLLCISERSLLTPEVTDESSKALLTPLEWSFKQQMALCARAGNKTTLPELPRRGSVNAVVWPNKGSDDGHGSQKHEVMRYKSLAAVQPLDVWQPLGTGTTSGLC